LQQKDVTFMPSDTEVEESTLGQGTFGACLTPKLQEKLQQSKQSDKK